MSLEVELLFPPRALTPTPERSPYTRGLLRVLVALFSSRVVLISLGLFFCCLLVIWLSCSTRDLRCGMWGLAPRPGIEPCIGSRVSATGPPRKSLSASFLKQGWRTRVDTARQYKTSRQPGRSLPLSAVLFPVPGSGLGSPPAHGRWDPVSPGWCPTVASSHFCRNLSGWMWTWPRLSAA